MTRNPDTNNTLITWGALIIITLILSTSYCVERTAVRGHEIRLINLRPHRGL